MTLASHAAAGPAVPAFGQFPTTGYISGDGSTVVWTSTARNLVDGLTWPDWCCPGRAFAYELMEANPDADGDGIDDVVDADGGDGSLAGAFADDFVFGSVTQTAGFGVAITDAPDPEGVRIVVTGTGDQRARLSVCGFTLSLSAGSDVILRCGSVVADVVAGNVQVELDHGLGVVTVPAGAKAEVGDRASGGYFVDVLSSTTQAPVTLAVAGTTRTLTAGSSVDFETWDFQGFRAPVDMGGVLNKVKAGSAVALKWRLLDANGAPVSNLTRATIRFVPGACGADAGAVDEIEQTVAGASGLQNLRDGNYQLNWKTPSTRTACGEMRLDVGDGVVHTALFRLS